MDTYDIDGVCFRDNLSIRHGSRGMCIYFICARAAPRTVLWLLLLHPVYLPRTSPTY